MAQTLSSAVAPNDVYGGDEVSALVLDPGYANTRAGFAGEDVPKSVLPSFYGAIGDGESQRLLFGDNSVHTPLANLEIKNPMSKDGTVEDWDLAPKLWEYAVTSRLTSFTSLTVPKKPSGDAEGDVAMDGADEGERALEENPLLMTETAWNPAKSREKAIEMAIESWGCPAFWLSRNSVLAAYAAGKPTALVVDVGATNITITPIHDGLILKKGIQRSPLAGNWVSSQIRALFNANEPKIELTPHYMIASKTAVDAGAPAQATYRKFDVPPTDSFRAFQEERVLTEFKESVVQVWPGPGRFTPGNGNEDLARTQPGRVFEMPDGSNQMWGAERYKVAEGMWDEKVSIPGSDAPTKAQTIPELIRASMNAVDIDLRMHLLANVVVTGGSSLLTGFTDRLNSELTMMYPGARIKLQAAGLTSERKFGSWVGGSILGSLGTFHQMWISKKEYEEFGASIVEKRCK